MCRLVDIEPVIINLDPKKDINWVYDSIHKKG